MAKKRKKSPQNRDDSSFISGSFEVKITKELLTGVLLVFFIFIFSFVK
ncbi:hypothetical protein JOD25_003279 [Kurthia huakuii]|nr:hypothetical protein [Kurthia huakuii]